MKIVDRIRKIIDYKGISERKFCQEIGVSNGFLGKVSDVGSAKLMKILDTYPEINPVWLLTGKGEMTIEVVEVKNNVSAENESKNTLVKPFDKTIEDRESNQYISALVKTNGDNKLCENYFNLAITITMISNLLEVYSIQQRTTHTVRKYFNKEIEKNLVLKEYQKNIKIMDSLYESIKPFAKSVDELYDKMLEVDSKNDRVYYIDFDSIEDEK